MPSPFECIAGKPVPKRLKAKLEEMDVKIRAQQPGIDDTARAKMLYDLLEEDLNANQRNLLRLNEVQARIMSSIDGKAPREKVKILLNTIEGPEDRRFADMLSVAGVRSVERAIMDGFVSDMYKEFTRRLATPGMTRNKGLQRNLAREAFEENTGDATAKAMVKSLRRMEAYAVKTMQNLGARIHYDPKRQFIVHHSSPSVGSVSEQEWVDFILPRLDITRMVDRQTKLPFTEETMRPVLSQLYHSIRTNGASDIQPGVKHFLPAWQRVDQSRFFIWKDFSSWESYNKRFGFGDDYFSAIVRYIDRMSKDVALFRVMGPDWDATYSFMRDLVQKASAEDNPAKIGSDVRAFTRAWDIASGKLGQPHNQWLAEAGASGRNIIQSAMLGGTAILQLAGDMWLQSQARQFNGLSIARQFPQFMSAISSLAGKGPKSAAADLSLRLGVPLQSIQHSILGSMRAIGEFDGRKWSHLIADTNFRLSGMTLITDAQQAAFGTEFVINLTENLGKPFSKFSDPQLGKALELYGVSEADWLRISKVAPTFDNMGVKYLDLINLTREVDYEVGARLMQMIHTELNARAVLTRTPASTRRLTFGTSPGTAEGEAVRFGTNLLSWPITYLYTQIAARWLEPGVSGASFAVQMANMFIGMTLMGGFATYVRDIASGKDPQNVFNPDFLLRAAATGGSFGIVGDWMFREHYSELDALSKAVGPGFGIAAHALSIPLRTAQSVVTGKEYNVGRDTTRLLRQITPFSTLWYGKVGFERLVFDQLQNWVDPKAGESFRQKRKRSAREHDQTYWWAPGDTKPARLPDVSRVLP